MTSDPLVLTINLKDYRLSAHQIVMLGEEFYARVLTNGEEGTTIELGFEGDEAKDNVKKFPQALAAFRL